MRDIQIIMHFNYNKIAKVDTYFMEENVILKGEIEKVLFRW